MADPEVSTVATAEKKDESRIEKIEVEVAYALPHEQVILKTMIIAGGTVADAIKHSGILLSYPEIDIAVNKLGLFGKMSKAATVLRAGDRVEIYRPLIADPKEVRRQRAAEGKRMKKGGGDLKEGEGKRAKAAAADTSKAEAPAKAAVDSPGKVEKAPAD
ncbi:MAG: RnfH family protein [Thiotrichaceae bacterium]|nr:RnfH family protein [Thiotrichaceae bacterium]PCI13080.1 MAG: RnfH family protein [Thiotrichales bacterium]